MMSRLAAPYGRNLCNDCNIHVDFFRLRRLCRLFETSIKYSFLCVLLSVIIFAEGVGIGNILIPVTSLGTKWTTDFV